MDFAQSWRYPVVGVQLWVSKIPADADTIMKILQYLESNF